MPMRAVTVAELPERLVEAGLSPYTARCYTGAVRRFDPWAGERGSSAAQATAALLVEYQQRYPRSRESRKMLRNGLRHYWGLLGRRNPPLAAVRVPRKPRYRCRALEPLAAGDLERAARARVDAGDAKGLVVLFGLYLGLRRAEIATLRRADFQPPAGGELVGWVRVFGKGELEADLPVRPELLEALARFPEHPSGWVFPGRYGGPVTGTTVWNWVREVAGDAGLRVTTHQLRHTALATANDLTHDLRSVQAFARHARPETTALYTRVTGKALVAVAMAISYDEAAG